MDPIDHLIHGAIHYEVDLNKNPYVTLDTIVQRLYRKMTERTRVQPNPCDKTLLFARWHDDILEGYEKIRCNLSHDERAGVERVLSKDNPNTTELTKFACCWYKYHPTDACRLFAVDGILGPHPKLYVHEAFGTRFARHHEAVRALYAYYTKPEQIKAVVERAFGTPPAADEEKDRDFEMCVALYAETVGDEEMKEVDAERKAKLQAQQPNKRKKPAST